MDGALSPVKDGRRREREREREREEKGERGGKKEVMERGEGNGDSAKHAPLGLYDLVHQAVTALPAAPFSCNSRRQ